MNSAGSKIVYECVSQRDLSVIWPNESPIRAAYRTSQLSIASATPEQHTQDSFVQTGNNVLGFSRLTSFITTLWKNPRYYRWILTCAISFVFAVMLGFINSFGALYMCLRQDLKSSATETGWVASLAWSLCLLSPLITAVYQRLGARMICLIGIVLSFVGLFSSTFVHNIWILYLTFGTLFGIGVNVVFVSSINLITAYFDSHECAMPTTLPGVGATTGMLIFCPVMEIVFKRFGWRMSLRVIAVIILVIGGGCSLLYRVPRSPEGKLGPDEENELETLHTKELKLKQKRERLRKSKDNYKALLKDPMHWVFGVATLISSMVLLCNVINLPLRVFSSA